MISLAKISSRHYDTFRAATPPSTKIRADSRTWDAESVPILTNILIPFVKISIPYYDYYDTFRAATPPSAKNP